MAVVILLISFTSIFLCLGISTKIAAKKELLIAGALIFAVILVVITEVLSLLHRLNYHFVFISWGLVSCLLLIYLYSNKESARQFGAGLVITFRRKLSQLTKADKVILLVCATMLLLIFMQGLLYPPNNYDSMTYHMARISSWVSHQSVSYYPTAIVRQLYQPPFAEYVIMHLGILSRTDLFSNSVQFVFLLLSITAILSILELFELGHTYKIMAILLCITIPEVTLQASSTQNDVVNAFFIITALFFSLKTIKQPQLNYYVFTGLSAGLALLTKGTAYIYLPPVLLLVGIVALSRVIKYKMYNSLWYIVITAMLAIGVNSGHYSRNYQLTHNFLGVDKTESVSYSNQKMSARLLLSSLVKNAGMHTAIMFVKPAANFSNQVIYQLHQLSGININDRATNYKGMPYSTIIPVTSEDSAPNPFHLLLITASILLTTYHFIKRPINLPAICLLVVLIMQTLLFCFYLKWQPWHSRLHIPLFLIAIPLVCYGLSISKKFWKITFALTYIMGVYALITVLHNDRRPYSNTIFEERRQKYFTGYPTLYKEYNAVTQRLQQANFTTIGLILGADDWEYPLFSRCFSQPLNPVYIEVDNFSKNAHPEAAKTECIISTTTNKPFIDFSGKRYINKTAAHKVIWLYE